MDLEKDANGKLLEFKADAVYIPTTEPKVSFFIGYFYWNIFIELTNLQSLKLG